VTDWIALAVAVVGTGTAARSLSIQANEHRRLTEELKKRADFEITIRPVSLPDPARIGADSAALTEDVIDTNVRFEIGVKNTGTRAAAHVTLNFLAEDRMGGLRWCGPTGEQVTSPGVAPATSEPLGDGTVTSGVRSVSHEFARIALRTPRIKWATVPVALPATGTIDLHVRAKAQSDDLPDD
jgi:hypothetical protein